MMFTSHMGAGHWPSPPGSPWLVLGSGMGWEGACPPEGPTAVHSVALAPVSHRPAKDNDTGPRPLVPHPGPNHDRWPCVSSFGFQRKWPCHLSEKPEQDFSDGHSAGHCHGRRLLQAHWLLCLAFPSGAQGWRQGQC